MDVAALCCVLELCTSVVVVFIVLCAFLLELLLFLCVINWYMDVCCCFVCVCGGCWLWFVALVFVIMCVLFVVMASG